MAWASVDLYPTAWEDMMQWLYRLQRHIAITKNECTVILVLALLFGLGLVIRYLQAQPQRLPSSVYAEADRVFEDASRPPAVAPLAPDSTSAVPQDPTPSPPYVAKTIPPEASINLNTAGASELQRLPRIGPKMAARIIAYREAHGDFRRVKDLVRVRGIGAKTLERLAPYLTVEEK